MPKAYLKLFKFNINTNTFNKMQEALQKIHARACLAWLEAVVNDSGAHLDSHGTYSFPVFSGESLGSLIPVAQELDKILGGVEAHGVIFGLLNEKPERNMLEFPNWMYSGNLSGRIKSFELGVQQGQAEIEVTKDRGFVLRFYSVVHQWEMAEKSAFGRMSAWKRLSLGRDAYKWSLTTQISEFKKWMTFDTVVQKTKVSQDKRNEILNPLGGSFGELI